MQNAGNTVHRGNKSISRSVIHQAPLTMEFSRQKYWSQFPFPPPGEKLYIKETSLMCIRGYPSLNCYRKPSLESLKSIPILYLWLAECLFLYLGFKVNDLRIFVSINLIANLKAQLKFFLLSSEEIAVNLLYDSQSVQLTNSLLFSVIYVI